jgi:hypothetical protein
VGREIHRRHWLRRQSGGDERPVIPCLRTFTRHGQSGIPVSDWFPHVGSVIDEIAVVRSMWCHEVNHFPAVIETQTGHRGRAFDHPTFGSWVSYALGSANKNLPTFVSLAGLLRHSIDRWLPRSVRGRDAVPGR